MRDTNRTDFHGARMVSDTAQMYASPSSYFMNRPRRFDVGSRMDLAFLAKVAQIILIDVVLSGDNAVVIAMAAHKLPEKQRRKAIIGGGLVAIVMRDAFTLVMAFLVMIP